MKRLHPGGVGDEEDLPTYVVFVGYPVIQNLLPRCLPGVHVPEHPLHLEGLYVRVPVHDARSALLDREVAREESCFGRHGGAGAVLVASEVGGGGP